MTKTQRKKSFMQLPIAGCKIDDLDKYFIFSYNKTLVKSKVRAHQQGQADFKPQGLWYGANASWIRFLYHEYVEHGEDWAYQRLSLYQSLFEIKLKNCNLLKMKTKKEIVAFNEKYGIRIPSRQGCMDYNHLINWQKVSKNYDGIEIDCESDLNLSIDDFFWLRTWDIHSGCLFNKNCIESIKLVYQVEK